MGADLTPLTMTMPRITSSSIPLLLWQIPLLDDSPHPVSALPLSQSESIGEDGAVTKPEEDEPELQSIADMVEEQIANGYAEGWERGLLEGREKGYAEGVAAGADAAQAALEDAARRLQAIIAQLGSPVSALDAAVEEAVAALALEVARCVIGSETSRSRDYLVRLIREAITKVPIETGAVKVVLNPTDLEVIRRLAPQIEEDGAVLVSDDQIEPGDCRLVADGQNAPIKDMRWRPRPGESVSQVELCLASRWRAVMLALFEGEDK